MAKLEAVPRVGESGQRAPTSLESSVGQQLMNDTKRAARFAARAAGAAGRVPVISSEVGGEPTRGAREVSAVRARSTGYVVSGGISGN